MRRRTELFLIYVAPILVLIASLAASLFTQITTQALLVTLASVIILQIAFVFQDLSGNLEGALEYIQKGAKAEPIKESDFYDRFRVDVRNAEERVYISYLDNQDPRDSTDYEKAQYYEDIKEIAKNSEDVSFRRIIRGITELEDWVDSLLDEHENDSNFSLACIPDKEPHEPSKPHVSVQLIDDNVTYFVAVGEQKESGKTPRDLRLESESVSDQWTKYYNRIWEDSIVVMERGKVQEEALEEYRRNLKELSSEI